MVRLADEMGLMVWEEIPVYWTIDFTSQNVYKKAAQQLTETIRRDRNRASVVIWSMANETPVSDARNKFIGDLATHARTMDGTRLVSAALLHGTKNGADTVDDPIGAKLDIVAFNQYLGWYGGNLENAESVKWSIPYNKPVVVSEFGGGAKFGLRGEKNERWTEDYQEYLYVQNLKMIDKIPNISGMSPWILKDFRSPRRMLAGIQDGYNRKGLFSDVGERKRAFYVLQDYYKKKGGETSYKLVWADEFDKDGQPDPSKWSYESGYIRNREKQYYTNRPENVRVESGNLVIEARKEAIKNPGFASTDSKNWKANREFTEYTSASITTRDKAEWLYGKIDIRARLPKGRGAWSALWMLGANWDEVGWPRCGEIDIVENVGFEPTTVHATVHTLAYNHTRGTQRGKTTELADIYN
ncbi:MAG TPA: family 16 glycosylhydrolase, partial [Pyrinomonadaceae bacterium]|nr:family 16 glycosylhydrolase [Pyrinomonadaceae bacterium]